MILLSFHKENAKFLVMLIVTGVDCNSQGLAIAPPSKAVYTQIRLLGRERGGSMTE